MTTGVTRRIRILADDLTGALDTAAAFAGTVPVFIDHPPAESHSEPVAALATNTRDVKPESLPERLQPALDWLRAGTVAFKKVDSLLRGNTFAETAWIARQGSYALTVFAPAFPAQGRITTDNRQWIVTPDGTRHGVADPLDEAFAALDRNVCATLDANIACDTWIPAVLTDADLDRVVASAEGRSAESLLWCGSAGLAHALARRWEITPKRAPNRQSSAPLPRGDGPTILISASFQPTLKTQWTRLCADRPPTALARHADDGAIEAALDQVRAGAREIWLDLSPPVRISPAQAAKQLAAQVVRIVERLPRPGQLVVVGGDTLLALCRASGAQALLAHPAVRPGWGCARLTAGAWDDIPCYSRSGAFGGPDDLAQMIRLLCNG